MTDSPLGDAYQRAAAVQEKYRAMLMAMPNVVGLGIGLVEREDTAGQEVGVIIMTDDAASPVRDLIPRRIDGVPVDVQALGPFSAQG